MPLRISHVDPACGQAPDGACVTGPHPPSFTLSRRQALFAGGALVVAYLAAASDMDESAKGSAESKPALTPPQLDSWIAVRADGSVVGYFGKVDIGLGIQVAVAQIIADELDVGFEQVSIVMGDTAATINQGGASGSTGLELGSVPLRNAAAQARSILLGLAAQELGNPVESLEVTNGVVSVRGAIARRISYGELIGGRYFDVRLKWNGKIGNELIVAGSAPLKDHAQYRVVGKSLRRADIADKLFGREVYSTDVRVPGMLHGRMTRPPIAGAVPVTVDRTALSHLPEVQLVWRQGLLGVVAAKEWDAVKAARNLRVEWSSPAAAFPPQEALYEAIEAA